MTPADLIRTGDFMPPVFFAHSSQIHFPVFISQYTVEVSLLHTLQGACILVHAIIFNWFIVEWGAFWK